MATIDIDLANLDRFRQLIVRLLYVITTVEDPSTIRQLEQAFYQTEAQQFNTQGGLTGGWPPLKPRYQAWKDRNYPGLPMMVLTGRLRNSLISRSGETIFMADPQGLRIGTRVPYAMYHQFGTRTMQARPVVPMEAILDRMQRILEEYLRTQT